MNITFSFGQEIGQFYIFEQIEHYHRPMCIKADREFNGVTIKLVGNTPSFGRIRLPGQPWQNLIKDHDFNDQWRSSLFYFETISKELELDLENFYGKVQLIFQYVAPLNNSKGLSRWTAFCAEPEVIPQSVWRVGLPQPKPGRMNTKTHHCIIHHSASNNSDTAYLDLVRSFYIQHTQVNGWDDIGYNYLIANNGWVIAGRDPELASIQQDNVLGAHYCGKNTNTMGVCMIGYYQDTSPSMAAMESLKHLLTWKCFKDGLMVLDSMIHPVGNQGSLLPIIAGHRDGCTTECPGNELYQKIPYLRKAVDSLIQLCPKVKGSRLKLNELVLFPSPTFHHISWETEVFDKSEYIIFDSYGFQVMKGQIRQTFIDVSTLKPGIYLLQLHHQNQFWLGKFIKT